MSILCVGELLIDFFCEESGSLVTGSKFLKKAGGAPANVAVAISRLGGTSAIMASVGDDAFGQFLVKTLAEDGVDVNLVQVTEVPTTMAFIAHNQKGEPDFTFNRGADQELDISLSKRSLDLFSMVHFGSATAFLGGSLFRTYKVLLEKARAENKLISFDPNYRNTLYEARVEEWRAKCLSFVARSDLVKVSAKELEVISGENNIADGIAFLLGQGTKLVFVTMGEEGVIVANEESQKRVESINVNQIDATGAGDAFVGGLLQYINKKPQAILGSFDLALEAAAFGAEVGALTCTRIGAIAALPHKSDITRGIRNAN